MAEGATTISILKDLGIVGAIATVTAAIITGLISLYFKGRSDKAVEKLKAELAAKNNEDIETLKAELAAKNNADIETLKAELAAKNNEDIETLRAELASKNNEAIEKLKAELTHENKLKSARVDYEYDARKRLYKEVEPIIFAAHLAAASVRARLLPMVERLRCDDISLDSKKNWFAIDAYYLRSTAYRIFLPMVFESILSKRISQYDFALEPLIGRKYMALAVFQDIPTGDFDLAQIVERKLPYEPYADVSEKERKAEVAKYKFQGIVRGDVQRFTALMTSTAGENPLPLEWYQFEQELENEKSALARAFVPIQNTLFNFHPVTHPVVWRAIIAYVLLAEFFIEASEFTIEEYDKQAEALGWTKFDFRETPADVEDAIVRWHFEAARLYVQGRLRARFKTLRAAEPA